MAPPRKVFELVQNVLLHCPAVSSKNVVTNFTGSCASNMGGVLSLTLFLGDECLSIKAPGSVWECAAVTDAIGAIAVVTTGGAILGKINGGDTRKSDDNQ